jgi:hypothetical protein
VRQPKRKRKWQHPTDPDHRRAKGNEEVFTTKEKERVRVWHLDDKEESLVIVCYPDGEWCLSIQ